MLWRDGNVESHQKDISNSFKYVDILNSSEKILNQQTQIHVEETQFWALKTKIQLDEQCERFYLENLETKQQHFYRCMESERDSMFVEQQHTIQNRIPSRSRNIPQVIESSFLYAYLKILSSSLNGDVVGWMQCGSGRREIRKCNRNFNCLEGFNSFGKGE